MSVGPFVAAIILSFGACLAAQWLGERGNIVDEGGERRSHHGAVARTGGLAIAASTALVLTLAGLDGLGFAGPAFLGTLFLLGFLDDLLGLSAYLRLLVQLVACLALVLVLPLPDLGSLPHWLALAASVAAFVWFINLYNFMDGINGLAGTEFVFLVIAALLLAPDMAGQAYGLLAAVMACVVAGFLLLNLRGRLFLGDGGSYLLAAMLVLLTGWTVATGLLRPGTWLILAALFIADASDTLIRRALAGETLTRPHRWHTYQRLADAFGRHWPVTCVAAAINTLVLLPLAAFHEAMENLGPLLVAAVYALLIAGMWWTRRLSVRAARG